MDIWTLENIIRTYKYIAIFSTIFFIIKFIIFSFIGENTHLSGDFDTADTETFFDFFSIQSILAFLMGFGWIGLASFSQWCLSASISVLLSVITGIVFMFLSHYLMLKVKDFYEVLKSH